MVLRALLKLSLFFISSLFFPMFSAWLLNKYFYHLPPPLLFIHFYLTAVIIMSAWLWDRHTGNSDPWNILPFQLLLFMSLLLTYSVPPKLAPVSPMPIHTHLWSRERFAAVGGADMVLALVDADPSLPLWHSEALHGTHGQLCPKDAGEFNPCCQYPLTFNKIDKVHSQTLVSLRQPSDTVPRMMNLEIHKKQCSPKLNGTEEHSGTNLDPQFIPQQRRLFRVHIPLICKSSTQQTRTRTAAQIGHDWLEQWQIQWKSRHPRMLFRWALRGFRASF